MGIATWRMLLLRMKPFEEMKLCSQSQTFARYCMQWTVNLLNVHGANRQWVKAYSKTLALTSKHWKDHARARGVIEDGTPAFNGIATPTH